MAARIVAAANGSPFQCFFIFLVFFFTLCVIGTVYIQYTRQTHLDIGDQHEISVSNDFHHTHNIPDDIARPAGSPWIVAGSRRRRRRRRERKQKRGRRSGVMLRLRKQPHKPPLPSLYLSNARSLVHKMDELELQLAGNRYVRDCCVLIVTETWFHPGIPDASVQLAGRTMLSQDRTKDSGKSRGGGLCIYVYENWCNNGTIIDRHCSPDVEYMSVRCRPFFLPRELTVVIVTAVYIPPDASVNTALSLLLNTINEQQRVYPNGVHIIAGDFNKANLKTVLPKLYQHVKCSTRGRTLWIMFTPTLSMPTEPYPSPTSASQTIFPSCFPQPTPPSDAGPGPPQKMLQPGLEMRNGLESRGMGNKIATNHVIGTGEEKILSGVGGTGNSNDTQLYTQTYLLYK